MPTPLMDLRVLRTGNSCHKNAPRLYGIECKTKCSLLGFFACRSELTGEFFFHSHADTGPVKLCYPSRLLSNLFTARFGMPDLVKL